MDSRLFGPKLQNHSIFKCFKESSEKSVNLRNLTELKDDVLFVWDFIKNCLLCVNLKQLEDSENSQFYQKLHLIQAPSFTVERILSGSCGTRMCLWGSRGAVVVELPTRWGRSGLFDGGKETILCKSYALDERFLYTQSDVRKVHWHPTSLSHILVLVSDNTLRLYNIALKSGPKLVKVFNIGSKPLGCLAGRRILDSLGDTAVDFTHLNNTDNLLILRGNGDVYMLNVDLESKSPLPPKLYGPLAMYPPADDNYGEDSCSIAVLDCEPNVVVIATCSHLLYHCLLLPETEQELDKRDDCGVSLYVIEAVELNINLTPDEQDLQFSYPVHLYPFSCNTGSYACVHAAGVHIVNLPIVENLKDFLLADDVESSSLLPSLCSRLSSARFSVCTRAPNESFSPPMGYFHSSPPLVEVALLCQGGNLVSRTLEPVDLEEQLYKELQLKNPALIDDDIKNILKERQKLSFSAIIQELLARDVSQPLLNTNKKQEPTPKESLEFLTQATLKLSGEYIARQQRATEAIKKKMVALRALNDQQGDWFKDLKTDINEVRSTSDELRSKIIQAEKHQNDLKTRCSQVIRALKSNASATPAERAMAKELEEYNDMFKRFKEQMDKLKLRVADKEHELKQWREDYKKKDIALGKSHSDTISSILKQQTSQIASLIDETKDLRDQMGIV